MTNVLSVLGYIAVGAVVGVLLTRRVYTTRVITAGRTSRAPVCNSCPFINDEQRAEIISGQHTERPPQLPLPMLDVGSGMHRTV